MMYDKYTGGIGGRFFNTSGSQAGVGEADIVACEVRSSAGAAATHAQHARAYVAHVARAAHAARRACMLHLSNCRP